VLGTLTGSALASGLLWLHPPFWVIMTAASATMFMFGYWVKRNYAIAIFFVTLFLVLLTEATGPVTIAFTLERLGATLAGGIFALLAAQVFWPVWERDRLPAILAAAFRATNDYLQLLLDRIANGGTFDGVAVNAKRRAEAATTAAFSSLQRMNGDPQNRREGLEHAATLVNGNHRIIRALAVVAVHLGPEAPRPRQRCTQLAAVAPRAFDLLARAVGDVRPAPSEIESLLRALADEREPAEDSEIEIELPRWLELPLHAVVTELSAMLIAVQEAAPALAGDRGSVKAFT
jgi:uncharacterized membrane protein YccC